MQLNYAGLQFIYYVLIIYYSKIYIILLLTSNVLYMCVCVCITINECLASLLDC
jgi:hypothetical protein